MEITITAATKILIIDEDSNTTVSTSLKFNDLPVGYTLPPMNEAGTQTRDVAYTGIDGAVSQTTM